MAPRLYIDKYIKMNSNTSVSTHIKIDVHMEIQIQVIDVNAEAPCPLSSRVSARSASGPNLVAPKTSPRSHRGPYRVWQDAFGPQSLAVLVPQTLSCRPLCPSPLASSSPTHWY